MHPTRRKNDKSDNSDSGRASVPGICSLLEQVKSPYSKRVLENKLFQGHERMK